MGGQRRASPSERSWTGNGNRRTGHRTGPDRAGPGQAPYRRPTSLHRFACWCGVLEHLLLPSVLPRFLPSFLPPLPCCCAALCCALCCAVPLSPPSSILHGRAGSAGCPALPVVIRPLYLRTRYDPDFEILVNRYATRPCHASIHASIHPDPRSPIPIRIPDAPSPAWHGMAYGMGFFEGRNREGHGPTLTPARAASLASTFTAAAATGPSPSLSLSLCLLFIHFLFFPSVRPSVRTSPETRHYYCCALHPSLRLHCTAQKSSRCCCCSPEVYFVFYPARSAKPSLPSLLLAKARLGWLVATPSFYLSFAPGEGWELPRCLPRSLARLLASTLSLPDSSSAPPPSLLPLSSLSACLLACTWTRLVLSLARSAGSQASPGYSL